jgi:uncharacterized membrane protein (DUF106 family)
LDQYTLYVIASIAFAYAIGSNWIVQKIGNPKRIKEIQQESKDLQKEMNDAFKAKDDKRLEEVNQRYSKFMPKMMEMMFLQMKPMLVILPALIVLMPLVKGNFTDFIITLPIKLPIFIQNLQNFPNWRDTFGVMGWFWLCVIAAGLTISIIKSIEENYIKKPKPS